MIFIHTGVDATEESMYFSGNSLGLQPKAVKQTITADLDKWAKRALNGHFVEPNPWVSIEDILVKESARIVGAEPIEVISMNGLTVNNHLAMVSPTPPPHI